MLFRLGTVLASIFRLADTLPARSLPAIFVQSIAPVTFFLRGASTIFPGVIKV